MNKPRALLVLVALLSPVALAQERSEAERRIQRFVEETGHRLELQETEEVPDWALVDREPRFRFVQIADVHWTPRRTELLRRALRHVSEDVKPDFVVLTGDNTSVYTLEGHRELKSILDEGLEVPWFAVRGDNDARHFADVFGSTRWSFDWGGVHFIGCGLDRDVEREGIGTFDPDTWTWLAEDLDAARDRPTIYFQHEPCVPPTFLDAPRLAVLLTTRSNVVAVVNGHLHLDLEFRLVKPHISALALGMNERHGIKVYSVHRDRIVARSHWLDGDRFRPANVFHRIDFPDRIRLSGDEPRERTNGRELPARPTRFDPELTERVKAIRDLLRRFGPR